MSTKKLAVCTIILLLLFPVSSFGYTVLDRFHKAQYGPGDLAYDEATDILWASDIVKKKIRKIDPSTGSVLTSLDVGYNELPLGLTYRNSYLWNSDQWAVPDGLIHKVDPADGSSIHSITGLGGLTFDHRGWLWCTNWISELSALDRADGSILDTITLPGFDPDYDQTLGLAFDESTQTLWVSVVTNAWDIPGGGPQTNFLLNVALDGTVLSTEVFDPDPALDGYQLVGLAFDNNSNILWANYSQFDRPPTSDDTYIYKLLPAAPSGSQWAVAYNGNGDERAQSVQQTTDGGYIMAGYTSSFGAGNGDLWVLKLNSDGSLAWQKTYGDTYPFEGAEEIQQTADGGYIVVGNIYLNLDWAIWILKLDPNGNIIWEKTYGGSGEDYGESIQQTSDGGYIVAGHTDSFGAGDYDLWVLKLDSGGNITWQKTYGGPNREAALSIRETSDGGYVVAGGTDYFIPGTGDVWVLKLDSSGNILWQKTYGEAGHDTAIDIQQTTDGGYIVLAQSDAFSRWVLKLNADGTVAWQNTYYGDGPGYYTPSSIEQTADGGYIVVGSTPDFQELIGHMWILKLNSDGTAAWEKNYGGPCESEAYCIRLTSDGGYIVSGFIGRWRRDACALKLDSNGEIQGCCLMSDSTPLIYGTSVSDVDTSVLPGVSAAFPGGTYLTPQNSSAKTFEICGPSPEPYIEIILPDPGIVGQQVNIYGCNFLVGTPKWVQLGTKKYKYGVNGKIISWADTQIIFRLPKYKKWASGTTKTKPFKVKVLTPSGGLKSNKYRLDINKP